MTISRDPHFRALPDTSGHPVMTRSGRPAYYYCAETRELVCRQGNHTHRWRMGEDGEFHPVASGKGSQHEV